MSFRILVPIAALSLCACDEPGFDRVPDSQAEQEPAQAAVDGQAEAQAEKEAKIGQLEREIENSTNIISDLEAAVLMERAKVEDNPDYDQSFLQETLADQQHQRELIERAQKQIEELKGSEE